jgi:hypothetical protein
VDRQLLNGHHWKILQGPVSCWQIAGFGQILRPKLGEKLKQVTVFPVEALEQFFSQPLPSTNCCLGEELITRTPLVSATTWGIFQRRGIAFQCTDEYVAVKFTDPGQMTYYVGYFPSVTGAGLCPIVGR